MDDRQFDGLIGMIGRRALIAALVAVVTSPVEGEAGKKGKKRRRRRRKQARKLRQQCLDACGFGCNCFYNVSGEIQCAGNFEPLCAEACSSDDDCATSNGCFSAFQLNGASKKSRFDCSYSAGVCINLGSC